MVRVGALAKHASGRRQLSSSKRLSPPQHSKHDCVSLCVADVLEGNTGRKDRGLPRTPAAAVSSGAASASLRRRAGRTPGTGCLS